MKFYVVEYLTNLFFLCYFIGHFDKNVTIGWIELFVGALFRLRKNKLERFRCSLVQRNDVFK